MGLAFFYFDTSDEAKQTSKRLLSSLAWSLTVQSKNYLPIKKLHERCRAYHPTQDDLVGLLEDLLNGFKQAYIVIDALDECDKYDQLCKKVVEVIHGWQLSQFHLLVTSRRNQDILDTLKTRVTTEIYLGADLLGNDIRTYILATIEEDIVSRMWTHKVQENVKKALTEGANGMYVDICIFNQVAKVNYWRFHWVACQMEELRPCRNEKMLVATLKSLPKDLETSYDRILDRVKSEDVPDVKTLLLWLVLGMRPLSLEELATVVTFDPSSGRFDPSLALFHPDYVIQLCSSLVTKGQDNTVRLAHASVKEYFLAKPRVWQDKWIIFPETRIGHGLIAYCCVKYLLQDGWNNNSIEFPLLEYASQFWPSHYSLSNKNASLCHTVMEFFKVEQVVFMEWVKMQHDTFKIYYDYGTELPLHYATAFGLHDVVQKLTMEDQDIVEYGKSLHIAVVEGHTEIVNTLLDKGVDANSHGGQYGSALQAASFMGHTKIVNILLDKGADVNCQGGLYGSALYAALIKGHITIANILLDKGAGAYDNALQTASFDGDIDIVHILLDKGADVNIQGGRYGNALQAASFMGHIDIVNILLDKGADVNSQSGQFGNALQAASFKGYIDIVNILLVEGADVNSVGGYYGNPLQAATFHGHIEIVNILLDKGADVNSQGGDYGNALQSALIKGHIKIVKLLLDKGADVNSQGGRYGNALQAASMGGYTEVVNILLDKGADVNSQGGEYDNALQAASMGGYIEVVNILLDKGADINYHGEDYGNALHTASLWGHTELVKLLLDKGADVNFPGGLYGNALQATLFEGHAEIFTLLLKKGAIPLEYTEGIDSYAIFNPKYSRLLDVQLVHNLVDQRCVQLCQCTYLILLQHCVLC